MLPRTMSTITRLLVPVLPIALMAMGCASEPDNEADQANANITGEEAAKELGHAALAQAGIPSVTPEAKELGIVAWDVYAYENEVTNSHQKVGGAVAFGVGEDKQVRYAIVIDTNLQRSAILRYDADAITDEFGADGANQSATKEELPAAIVAAFDTERQAIADELDPSVMGCAAGLAAAALGTAMVVGTVWIASVALMSGAWSGVAFFIQDAVVPAASLAGGAALGGWIVNSSIDLLKNDCGGLLAGK